MLPQMTTFWGHSDNKEIIPQRVLTWRSSYWNRKRSHDLNYVAHSQRLGCYLGQSLSLTTRPLACAKEIPSSSIGGKGSCWISEAFGSLLLRAFPSRQRNGSLGSQRSGAGLLEQQLLNDRFIVHQDRNPEVVSWYLASPSIDELRLRFGDPAPSFGGSCSMHNGGVVV